MTPCDLCAIDSPRIDLRNHCCAIRLVSKLPRERRQAYYETVRRDEGEEALKVLIAAVNAEYKRRMDLQKGEQS